MAIHVVDKTPLRERVVERKLFIKETPFLGRNLDEVKYLRIGKITRVDYERGHVDVEWVDALGGYSDIQLPSAFSTGRATLNGMPEVGSFVVCGWIHLESDIPQPIILNYLDVDLGNALLYSLDRGKISQQATDVNNIREKIGYNIQREKRRKVYPGEIDVQSTEGGEIFIDDGVLISDNMLDEIEISPFDQSIRFSSMQQYTSTEAVRISNGMITREPINQQTEFVQPTILSNGKKVYIVTDSQNPFHLGGTPFTEYRIEAYDKGDGVLNVNEINSGVDVDQPTPSVTLILGTFVGNDKNDISRYAKVLRPQIFGTPYSNKPTIDDLLCLPEEYNTLSSIFQLKFKSGSKIDFDKQGHLFSHITASTNQHPLGEGRSWEGNFDGSIKWVVGANRQTNNSIILDTAGGIKQTLGSNNESRSLDISAQKGVLLNILGTDSNGISYELQTTGDVFHNVGGNLTTTVTGDYTITVSGKITEQILGTKNENYLNDKNVIYGGNFKEVVIKDKQVSVAGISETTIAGTKDNVPVSPTTTSNKITVAAGTLEVTTMLGKVVINALTNNVEITGTLKVSLNSGVLIEHLAPMVNLGQSPIRGGVITGLPSPSHYDYIVGSPLVASQSVMASL